MYQSPKSAKRLYFDVIPKATDEYLQQLDAYNRTVAETGKPALDNPAWHVHRGAPPEQGSPVSFSLLLNLVSAADASTKDILWGFIVSATSRARRRRPSRCSTSWPATRSTTTRTS
jgi:lysyl-tRNA synthetase class 1